MFTVMSLFGRESGARKFANFTRIRASAFGRRVKARRVGWSIAKDKPQIGCCRTAENGQAADWRGSLPSWSANIEPSANSGLSICASIASRGRGRIGLLACPPDRLRCPIYAGTSLVLAIAAFAAVTGRWWWLLAVPVAGYGFAWIAHFAVERNRPATFTYPLWSLAADFRMWWLWITGRLGPELERE